MLEYAYKLESFEFLEGSISIQSIDDLFERLANILAKRILDRNRKGLYRNYLERTENLTCVRGRVNIVPTTVSILRGSLKIVCEYQEHTADLEDNQILVWTLFQLRHFNFQRQEVKRNVRQAYRELINKVGLSQIEPRVCMNRFYHRLNQDYQPMHGLSRFFLEHCGPGLEIGEYNFIPFVIFMPKLFESFVAEWLKVHLPSGYQIDIQYKAAFEKGSFVFYIDLVLKDARTDTVLAVLDTKYKRKATPDNADIQQIIAYAVSVGTENAFLIYPSPVTGIIDDRVGPVRIRSIVFNIGEDPELAGQKFLETLLTDL